MTPRQKIANEIVSAGLRALALKRHPDVEGGSNDAMRELNEAVEWLREFVDGKSAVTPPKIIVPQPPAKPRPDPSGSGGRRQSNFCSTLANLIEEEPSPIFIGRLANMTNDKTICGKPMPKANNGVDRGTCTRP